MKWLILMHVLGASVWVGGHLVLSIGFLPRALRTKDVSIITGFERGFEPIGIPALLTQIITGLWMASIYIPPTHWFSLVTTHHQYLWIKIGLVLGTLGLAVHARFFIIPKLTNQNLPSMAFHIVMVTVLAVALLLTGLSFRYTYL
ncbi:MAG TPA: CopD family protein [Cyclobacteriaceae bacterium]|jgi:putative copper export protein|nr:CopD family protein [Cytophagales bacterium]HNT51477.1 CopD family protein [Cyclobacteriaceae bacterium]HRE66186.1 CopD family protein [Cyclobacteriaceae bacterium]HRF32123.1 CopD family protein [Cyclobacteriaceae bacterium]